MSPVQLDIRDAGPLDLEAEVEAIDFEDELDPGRGAEACLADPWVTATTRFSCD
ncbi:SflA family class IV lanthipeptide [Streptomyces sp. NPDC006733]|uniref:SflA family class IV lanthipeptide n=1 Tax=Streptomyces sp. NPDC006733 TaxID=3155460 RepID=UPI0033E029B9